MNDPKRGMFGRVAGQVWRVLSWARKLVFGLFAVFFLILLVVGFFASRGPKVPNGAILVLKMEGSIVEQLSADPVTRAFREASGQKTSETLVWDVVDALHAAKEDDRIKAVFLDLSAMGDLGSLGGSRVAGLTEVKQAIQDFRKSGKKVVAAADAYTDLPYSLAAQADEIYLHTMGFVLLEGLGRYRNYYKEGLDRLEVEMNIVRVGEYKSAVEPYLRNDMSAEDRRAATEWMGDLWQSLLAEIAAARKLQPADLESYATGIAGLVQKASGDLAAPALAAKLVDHVGPREEVRARLVELAGEDEETHSYRKVSMHDYLKSVGKDRAEAPGGSKVVAVVVAKGEIQDGEQPPGTIGGDSTAALLRKARRDEKVKAVVLRVDSPGGSAFASEVIREECAKIRKDGKPLVVSMGAVAASGGYWISTASDEIWARPDTITGSIGIFGMFPTVEKPLAKYLGVHTDGVGTTPFANFYRPDRALEDDSRTLLEQLIHHGYADFLSRVAESRKKTTEQVDQIARGRVWSGKRALEIGLVDKLGGLNDAVASAAERAKLGTDFKVRFIEKDLKWQDRLLAGMAEGAVRSAGRAGIVSEPNATAQFVEKIAAPVARAVRALPSAGVYALCEECTD